MEELGTRMKRESVGVKIGEKVLALLLFTDDIVLLAEKKEDLKKQMETLGKWSQEWRMDVNEGKTKVMVVGGDEEVDEEELMIGNKKIGFTDTYEYLGVKLNKRMARREVGEEILRKMDEAVKKRKGVLSMKYMSVKTKTQLYKTYVRPVVEYGSEVWMMNKSEENAAEAKQMTLIKELLKLPKRMSNCVIRGDCELEKLKVRRNGRMLKQWARGMNEERGSLLRICTEMKYAFRGAKKSWPNMIGELLKTYRLEDEAEKLKEEEMTLNEFIKKMENRIEEVMVEDWKKEVREMKNGRYFKVKKEYGVEEWMKEEWNESKRIKMMWRSNASGLMEEKWRRKRGNDDSDDDEMEGTEKGVCPMCKKEMEETVEHVLLQCSAYDEIREEFGKVMTVIMGEGKEKWMKELKSWKEDKIMNVLVGDGSGIEEEVRTKVVDMTEQLLFKIYYQRKQQISLDSDAEQLCGAHGTMITMA
eukprot:GCRY01001719.1.p1 GENE.GCRY01001719.1~~GCRY01001719.1.p1  ORF type:complete len:483 (-),score=113.93 GCRY01001719.1:36-1454(-)